jgi:hypothetical protein
MQKQSMNIEKMDVKEMLNLMVSSISNIEQKINLQ